MFRSDWSVVVRGLVVLVALGCSSGDDDDDGPGTPAGTGGATGSGGTTVGGGGSGGTTTQTGSGGVSGSGGKGAMQAGSGGAKMDPDSGMSDTDAAVPGTAITECDGKPLPKRAIATMGPYAIGPAAAGLEAYWPTDDWRAKTPDELGFDAAKLQAAADYSTPYSGTEALLIIRHGYIALEEYPGSSATTRHESYSMAKSFTSALTGIAIDEGLLDGVDDKVCEAYPDNWDCADTTDKRSRITIKHSLNIMTGLQWEEDWRSSASGTNDAIVASITGMLDTVLAREGIDEPGTKKRYSTGDPSLMSGVLQKATGMTALAYAKTKLFAKIGTPGITWQADSRGRTTTYAGLSATAREFAKFGYLYLNRGTWDGEQVVSSAWVDMTTRAPDPCADWYYYAWHINAPVRLGTQGPDCAELVCKPTVYADLPPDAFFALGVNGQMIFVVPSADMVIVRLASDQSGSEHWDEYAAGLLGKTLDAIK